MPELPEVETVARRLAMVLPGKVIQEIRVLRDKSFQGEPQKFNQVTVNDVSRRAKILRIHLDHDQDFLVHLKMTGQLLYLAGDKKVGGGHPSSDWLNELPSSHTRVVINFADGSTLFFNDMRVFGWIRALNDQDIDQEFTRYGPDVNSAEVTVDYLKQNMGHRGVAIKQALMNNAILAGVGNIYASEALFYAGIHPQRPAKSLTDQEWIELHRAVKMVIKEGIKAGGTTFDGKYVGVDGIAGSYQNKLKVYGQEGEACQQCGTTIEKIKQGGRGTYFCPQCQG